MGDHDHQLKCRHDDEETRNNNNITISQMPSTRCSKINYMVGPEHHGRYASVSGTFTLSIKRQMVRPWARRFQMSEAVDSQKRRIRISRSISSYS
jgi:hypothetical protein